MQQLSPSTMPTLLPTALTPQRTSELLGKWATSGDLVKAFLPANQHKHAELRERCFTGMAPTLSEMDALYNTKVSISWLVTQLAYLNEMVGNRYKMNEAQLDCTANDIAANYYWLKISELQLFFYQFRLGKYEQFFGAVDPQAIMRSLKVFLIERAEELDKHDQELKNQEREQWKHEAISYQEYLTLKKQSQNETQKQSV